MVVDTNIFVSSFFGGHPKTVIDYWKTGKIKLCLTNSILEEYVEVLNRLDLEGEAELQELLLLLRRKTNLVFSNKTHSIKAVRDDDDNKFIECAVALEAKYIISGDKDLTVLKQYMNIPILSPRFFIKVFNNESVIQ